MNSLKVRNFSLIKPGMYKIDLGIPLGIWAVHLAFAIVAYTVVDWSEFEWPQGFEGYIVKFLFPCWLFMMVFLPSLCIYNIFGSHEFIVRHGGLTHRIFVFNVKIIERDYENIANVGMREPRIVRYKDGVMLSDGPKDVEESIAHGGLGGGKGSNSTHYIDGEVYIVSNQKNRTLIKSFKSEMIRGIFEFLQRSLRLG